MDIQPYGRRTTEITIRRANVHDANAIAAVYVTTSSRAERGFIPDAMLDAMTPADYVQSWERRLGSPPPHATLAAEFAAEIVGFCYVMPSADDDATPATGHLDMLFVAPHHAGHGIGARLLAAGTAHLRAAGFTEATLWVLAGNERTQRFYRREGWTATETLKLLDEEG